MLRPIHQQLEARLRRSVPAVEADRQFVHRLRRALLNADTFGQRPLTRFFRPIGRMLPIAAGALAVGFLAALGVNYHLTPDFPPPTSVTVVNPTVLERLSHRGQIQTVTVSPTGTKLHRIRLTSGETLEILEPAAPGVPPGP